ncbi:MAG: NADH-quinone oxidoreductase subunit N [Spirochaetes bacterium]|nr:MAG: NADH-quinone oxidoreductase subunit N [Spirochaetota bacterium]
MEKIMLKATELKFSVIMPETILVISALIVLMIGIFMPKDKKSSVLSLITLIGVIVAFFSLFLLKGEAKSAFYHLVVADPFAIFFKVVFLIILFLVTMISINYSRREDFECGEYYALTTFATVGMMFMASGTNFITIFVGLETMSLSIYVLATFMREDNRSIESGLKYFLLGAFATGFLLYGMALIYGTTGTMDLVKINNYLSFNINEARENYMFLIGLGLLIIGFGFKVALVPFHMWTPDVYEGAPTSITAYMATGVKAAAFAAFVRVFFTSLISAQIEWISFLWLLAVITMTVGNIIALVQDNIKRMLAYSSIAHAGYMMVGFVAGNELGISGILFYLLAYAFMNIGAFSIVILLGKKGEENTLITDYAGIGFKYPLLSAAMTIFLLSLAGIPPLAGFMGKFYVFSAAVKAHYYWLVIIAVLNSAVAVYYYLRVTVMMYFKPAEKEITGLEFPVLTVIAVIISVWAIFHIGIFPSSFLSVATSSIKALLAL